MSSATLPSMTLIAIILAFTPFQEIEPTYPLVKNIVQ